MDESDLERNVNALVGPGFLEMGAFGAAAVILNAAVVAVAMAVIAVTFALVDGAPVAMRRERILPGVRLEAAADRLTSRSRLAPGQLMDLRRELLTGSSSNG